MEGWAGDDVGRMADATSPSQAEPLRYEFFTPYFRGFDLVWDFLCKQPEGAFSEGALTIKATYGSERARDLRLFVAEQQIGHGADLWERFAALVPVFRLFWGALERAATDWQEEQRTANAHAEAEGKRRDDELCARVLGRKASPEQERP